MGIKLYKSPGKMVYCSARADEVTEAYVVFHEGRVVPLFYYLPGLYQTYIVRVASDGEDCLPNIEGMVRILLQSQGRGLHRQKKLIERFLYYFREQKSIDLDSLSDRFYYQLGILLEGKNVFHKYNWEALYRKEQM